MIPPPRHRQWVKKVDDKLAIDGVIDVCCGLITSILAYPR
jgi:hypothetical protein